MKTELTKDIEKAVYDAVGAHLLGVYGCYEVSFGAGYGDQYCDFVTMASDNVFRCYEIKITASDFRSKSKLSFAGDYNYFVMPAELYEAVRTEIPFGIGVYLYKKGKCKLEKKANKKNITIGQRVDLMHGMIRSLSRYTTKIVRGQQ
jgi:hypothetical protein